MRMPVRLVNGLVGLALLTQLSACGTLFYPERRGQISGKIDSAVVVMDAVGLLIFIIPGLIAFAVDFATGAIYLPDSSYSVAPQTLREAIGADGELDTARLEAILLRETGRQLPLAAAQLIQPAGGSLQLASYGLSLTH